jgi:hypothetical protein
VSFANVANVVLLVVGKSAVYGRYNNCSSTLPCGTPDFASLYFLYVGNVRTSQESPPISGTALLFICRRCSYLTGSTVSYSDSSSCYFIYYSPVVEMSRAPRVTVPTQRNHSEPTADSEPVDFSSAGFQRRNKIFRLSLHSGMIFINLTFLSPPPPETN